ncbi:hypothetical protein SY88_14215 [Clostridiales bacterium PH28_bin88]|nr:hypothetical protein SY88_14215 [Clostridiales bacterium PH28_bin88]
MPNTNSNYVASTERIERLCSRLFNTPMEVSVIRARKFTEAREKYADRPLIIQRALALKDTLEATPAVIYDDELIVGHATDKFRGAAVYPEVRSQWLMNELKAMEKRFTHHFRVSAEEAKELEQIAAAWVGRTAHEQMVNSLTADERELHDSITVVNSNFGFGLHLFYPDMQRVLAQGLDGLLEDTRRRRAAAVADARGQEQIDFYDAVEIVLAAAQDWILKYAAEARSQAARADGDRSRELQEIAGVLSNLAHKPAATFHEGLQMVYLAHLLLDLADGGHEIPYGRLDQLLYLLYAADRASGRTDQARARELIEAFYIQSSTITHFMDGMSALGVDGNPGRLDITLGGVDETGRDATNELSHLFLSTMDQLRTTQPNVMVRLHEQTPEDFFDLVIKVMTDGSNVIAVFNDEVNIEALTSRGVDLADARDYAVGGCVSILPRGTYGPMCGSHVFSTKVLERVLLSGKNFESYDEFYQAFKHELSKAISTLVKIMHKGDAAHKDLLPQPLVSAFVEGPLATGKDIKEGGGRNNFTGMNFVGFANIVDSLAAIKHLVFTSGEMTFEELARAIGANYAGHEKIQQLLLTRAPKYGNDNDLADAIARDLFAFYHDEVTRHKTFRGGQFVPGLISATLHMLAGAVSAATPDGRPAKFPLAIGGAPATGASRQGPTAAIKSITGIDHKQAAAGIAVNMRFHPSLFETAENIERFKELVKTYFFELHGQHLQLTVIDSETLKKAKAEPEKYTDLLVRVAGYSARFIDLSPMTQDELIARTEYASL